jgi:phage tail-like protein
METEHDGNYFYLNREGIWRDFRWTGLELRPDGALALASVPRLVDPASQELENAAAPVGPAGMAVDDEGNLIYSRPPAHALFQIHGCAGKLPGEREQWPRPVPCAGGKGHQPTQFVLPRGLLFYPGRKAVLAADSGNDRIQLFHPGDWQLLDIWSVPHPCSLAGDSAGHVYVVTGEQPPRVLKLDPYGAEMRGFGRLAAATTGFGLPVAVAVAEARGSRQILVLDAGRKIVIVLDEHGRWLGEFGAGLLEQPLVVASDGTRAYIGDTGRRQVVVFQLGPRYDFSGAAYGYRGPVAALAVDGRGTLWLYPGCNQTPLRFQMGAAYGPAGLLWGGPFGVADLPVEWRRLRAAVTGLKEGSHVRFYLSGGMDAGQPPPDPIPGAAEPFAATDWAPLPLDIVEGMVPACPDGELPVAGDDHLPRCADGEVALRNRWFLWVGAHFSGEGPATPVLSQMRLDFNTPSYRQFLPEVFGEDAEQTDLLDRLLYLYQGFYDDIEGRIALLRRYFDPRVTPTAWLRWLAGWLALDVDARWEEDKVRETIGLAMELYARRGTLRGLRNALLTFGGVWTHIEQPIQFADWWSLVDGAQPDGACAPSYLGLTTRLAPVEADGAVLGTTAVLEGSHVIGAEHFGESLFQNVAHQFTVRVYGGQLRGEQLERVRQVVDREKPAHTIYDLCVIEPMFRVGFQAVLGVDTVVAGPDTSAGVWGASPAHPSLLIGGEQAGRIGERSSIGQTTRLAAAAPQ